MSTTLPPVTLIGLGAMGRALAGAFIAAGHPTTIWNRTAGRADELVTRGAVEAASPLDAVRASPLTVICVLDRGAVDGVLDAIGDGLLGATLVNLTTATPEDARAIADRVTAAGGRLLSGTIMVPTPVIGTPDSSVLTSGDVAVHDEHVATLRAIGAVEHLGDDHGLAAIHDLGMLDIFFNGMAAFLHASALVGADGVTSRAFVPYAVRMLDLLRDTFAGLADDVDGGVHPGAEDNLEMEQAFLRHIVEASEARGVDATLPAASLRFVDEAIAAGHGRDSFSRVIDVLRSRAA